MQDQPKKRKGPPSQTLHDKQILPLMGLGTYMITDAKELTEILKCAIHVGYRHFDSARFYENEYALGLAIETCIKEGRCKRQDLFITSKTFNHVDKNPITELKQALASLNLKYVDLYYLHVPALGLDGQGKWTHRQICDIWKDMEECVRKGYTKHIGISNFNGQNVLDLLSYARIKPIVNQIEYHPYLQQASLVEICQKNGIHVIAYAPLGHPGWKEDCNLLKDEAIVEIAQKYSKTPSQIILKFTLSRGVGVVPKTKTVERLKENFDSWSFELSEQDVKKIKALNRNLHVFDFTTFFSDDIDLFD